MGLTHAELDITDAAAVGDAVAEARPDVVINCAAYTDVDGAEEHADEAHAGERRRRGHRGRGRRRPVLYASTDYVFDGTKREPYVESDPTGPQSSYGRSKLAGEHATAAANPRHFIVRTSWLFGAGGRNFVDTMLRVGERARRARVVADQVGCPTYTGHLADGAGPDRAGEAYGVHHVAAAGQCSWFEFASAIFERAGVDCRLEPCTADEFARPAPRPAYSVLGTEREPSAARLAGGPRRLPGRARGARMKLLVTGAAGFIGSTYVRARARTSTTWWCSTSSPTPAGARTCPRACRSVRRARSRTAVVVREAMEGVRRGRQLRRRVARGPLDRRPGRLRAHARDRHR